MRFLYFQPLVEHSNQDAIDEVRIFDKVVGSSTLDSAVKRRMCNHMESLFQLSKNSEKNLIDNQRYVIKTHFDDAFAFSNIEVSILISDENKFYFSIIN